jgi:cytochrome c oxidase subunit 2
MHAITDGVTPQAALIESLWWLLFAVCTAVFVVVIGLFLWAAVRAARRPRAEHDAATERRLATGVGDAVGVTVAILLFLLVASLRTGRALSALGAEHPLEIEVTGHQWWWEIRYPAATPADDVLTANEIHVPVGRPVHLSTTSQDVIHSFWAPSLHGKKDLIPGRTTTTTIRVDRPGVYRGQCAEFCGLQHAHMGFLVVAEPPASFDAWLAAQRNVAAPPADPASARGQAIFLEGSCVVCHTVRGTPAAGRLAPDLTHLASRRTIAALTLPNTPGNLAGWILDPQHVKPGTQMPPTALRAEQVQPLLAYLDGLR